MIAFPSTERAAPTVKTSASEEDARLNRILDYAEAWSLNYFKLRKPLGSYKAGQFIDRITLETLLFG